MVRGADSAVTKVKSLGVTVLLTSRQRKVGTILHVFDTASRSSVAQWSRLLNATVPDGLMALAGLGSNLGLEGSFSARLG